MGTCFAFAADGAACGAANDNELDCQAPALCVSGICTRVNSATCNSLGPREAREPNYFDDRPVNA